MNKISSSIERINYPRGFVSQFGISTGSCGFFPDELNIKNNLKWRQENIPCKANSNMIVCIVEGEMNEPCERGKVAWDD